MTSRRSALYSAERSDLPISFVREYASMEGFVLWDLADLEELSRHGEELIAARTDAAEAPPSAYVLRSSLWVMTYAVVESWLAKISRLAETTFNLPTGPEFRAQGLKRYAAYLKKPGGLSFPDQSRAWAHLLAIGAIRNSIVHDGGRRSDKVLQAVRTVRHVTAEEDEDEIWLEEEAVAWATRVAREFATELRTMLRLSRSELGENDI